MPGTLLPHLPVDVSLLPREEQLSFKVAKSLSGTKSAHYKVTVGFAAFTVQCPSSPHKSHIDRNSPWQAGHTDRTQWGWWEGLVPNTRCRRAQGGDSHLSPHPRHCAIMRPYLEHSRPLFFSRSMRKFLSLVVGKVTSACCLLSRPVSCSQGLWRHSEAEGLPLGQTEVRGQSWRVCAA